jgi:sentrin-specific protease 1
LIFSELLKLIWKKNGENFDHGEWTREINQQVPQQSKDGHCGAFVLTYALFYAENKTMKFTEEDMLYYRRKIAFEILKGI